jgi:hypothetical protein
MAELRLTRRLYDEIRTDLARPHPFAYERMGFVFAKLGNRSAPEPLVLLTRYRPVADEEYLDDDAPGAHIRGEAIRSVMQEVLDGRARSEGAFHVHLHKHRGETGLSPIDREGLPPIVRSFLSVGKEAPHGLLVFSKDHGSAWIWLPGQKEPVHAPRVVVVGAPLEVFEAGVGEALEDEE